jgi:hypothetical protein
MPRWAMDSLGVRPFEMVDVSFVRIKLAALVVLQPLTRAWDELVAGRDPAGLLEREVNKYASLTAGATVSIAVGGVTYLFRVRETRAEGGVAVRAVRVQDSDIRVDVDRSALDEMIRREKEEEERERREEGSGGGRTLGD